MKKFALLLMMFLLTVSSVQASPVPLTSQSAESLFEDIEDNFEDLDAEYPYTVKNFRRTAELDKEFSNHLKVWACDLNRKNSSSPDGVILFAENDAAEVVEIYICASLEDLKSMSKKSANKRREEVKTILAVAVLMTFGALDMTEEEIVALSNDMGNDSTQGSYGIWHDGKYFKFVGGTTEADDAMLCYISATDSED